MESIADILNYYDDIIFLSYFTIKQLKEEIDNYLSDFSESLLKKSNAEFWILGKMLNSIDMDNIPPKIKCFKSIQEVTDNLI